MGSYGSGGKHERKAFGSLSCAIKQVSEPAGDDRDESRTNQTPRHQELQEDIMWMSLEIGKQKRIIRQDKCGLPLTMAEPRRIHDGVDGIAPNSQAAIVAQVKDGADFIVTDAGLHWKCQSKQKTDYSSKY